MDILKNFPIDTKVFFNSPPSVLMAFDFLNARVLQTNPTMLEELKTGIQTDCGYFTGRASESNVKPTFSVSKCSPFDRRRLTVIVFTVQDIYVSVLNFQKTL
jgi:hypothetical protein